MVWYNLGKGGCSIGEGVVQHMTTLTSNFVIVCLIVSFVVSPVFTLNVFDVDSCAK